MKKKWEVRYIVTAVASIPVYKVFSKTEAYKEAAKPGWGVVDWQGTGKEKALVCDEDSSADIYTKDGGYFGISPLDEVKGKDIPKQADAEAILISDSCGYTFWTKGQIRIFVTYEESGLVDTFHVEYGEDARPYDGETELAFEDLYEAEGPEWDLSYRAEIPGTVEYQLKQEAATLAQEAGATWMDEAQREQFRRICNMIDTIKSGRDFYRVMNMINGNFDLDVINMAREFKQCFNSAQYEPQQEAARPAQAAEVREDDQGITHCGDCGAELLCNRTGDMPDTCPHCRNKLEYNFFIEPDGPDADIYRTHTTTQDEAGTAAEAASEGRETALGTPDKMAGTDTTVAADGQQAPPWAREINLGKLYAETRPKEGGGLLVQKINPP